MVYGSDSVGFFLVGGYELKGAITELDGPWISAPTEESQGLGVSWPIPKATGVRNVDLKQNGFFNDAEDSVHFAMKDTQDVRRVFALNLTGNVAGQLMDFADGGFGCKYQRASSRNGLHKASAEYKVSGAVYQDGVILKALAAVTADGNSTAAAIDNGTAAAAVDIVSSSVANPSVIETDGPHGLETGDTVLIAGHTSVTPNINGVQVATVIDEDHFSIPVNVSDGGVGGTVTRTSTRDGAACVVSVGAMDLDGHSGLAVKVRDSADNVTFGDLVAFTAVTGDGRAAEVKLATGAVEQYVAASWDFTGAGTSPSAEIMVGMKRLEGVE